MMVVISKNDDEDADDNDLWPCTLCECVVQTAKEGIEHYRTEHIGGVTKKDDENECKECGYLRPYDHQFCASFGYDNDEEEVWPCDLCEFVVRSITNHFLAKFYPISTQITST